MKRKALLAVLLIGVTGLFSCRQSKEEQAIQLFKQWEHKEIKIPDSLKFFTLKEGETEMRIPSSSYRILSYMDNVGCISCKLKIEEWLDFKACVDSLSPDTVPFLFFFYPQNVRDIKGMLRVNRIQFPVCLDGEDLLNKANHFPHDYRYQTFLLDGDNRVVAMGNPVHNMNVRKLYLKIIARGEYREQPAPEARMECSVASVNMGSFEHTRTMEKEFFIRNVGKTPLVINKILASCGCTTVDYDRAPARPGDSIRCVVRYKANRPEFFRKSLTIYSNAVSSPMSLIVTGNAK